MERFLLLSTTPGGSVEGRVRCSLWTESWRLQEHPVFLMGVVLTILEDKVLSVLN